MELWQRSLGLFAMLAFLSVGWLLIFFIVPLFYIAEFSFSEMVSHVEVELTFTLSNYSRIFNEAIIELMIRSLRVASLTTLVCLFIGFPVALLIATAPAKAKPWLLLTIILPFWTNLLIRTYALLNILGTRGRLNGAYKWLWEKANAILNTFGLESYALLGERFVPIKFLGNEFGVTYGMIYIFLPFTVLPIYAALERLDKSYLEASLDLGHGQFSTFFRILVPLSTGGIVAGAIITFIPALGQFFTPELLGRGNADMVANVIERQFKRANDWPFGSAMSLFFLYITFMLLTAKALYDARMAKRHGRLES